MDAAEFFLLRYEPLHGVMTDRLFANLTDAQLRARPHGQNSIMWLFWHMGDPDVAPPFPQRSERGGEHALPFDTPAWKAGEVCSPRADGGPAMGVDEWSGDDR